MTRAISPVVAAPLLILVVILLAAIVGVMATGFSPSDWHDPRVLSVEATSDGAIEFYHESGSPINTTTITVHIEVNGEPLEHQPPVPFVGARGFSGAPSGAFNPSTDPLWAPGDRTRLKIAETNSPALHPGDTVTVQFIKEESRIAIVETTVERQ